ncbi:hypothetical protein FRC17_009028 [Serendipita sp. 399]|nr:hypothetical protein FRC17_009028 [Serendipita sp. 399]
MKYYSERVDISDGIIPKFDSPFKPGRARVILLGDAERDIMDYLQHAPLLTAFAGGFSLLDISSRTATHSFLARLTHLSLHHMSVKQTVIALHLPRVRFLRIELTLREDEKPPETLIPFDSWVVPNLASLIIRGNTGKAYYQDFLRFLYRHSSTVEHLVMHLYTLFHGDLTFYRLDIHSLQRFPHLKGLGLGVIKDTKNLDTVDEDIPMRLSLLIILLEASFSTRFIITLLGSTHEAPRPRGTGDG